jgi:peroxiredoxin
MVVVLSRGAFCLKDRRQHESLLQLHREMDVGYCRLATISTDNITETNEFRTGVGAHWPFLSDPNDKIASLIESPTGPQYQLPQRRNLINIFTALNTL